MKTLFRISLLAAGLLSPHASAVIVVGASGGGNTNNTTQAQFESEYGTSFPIYDNVIQYSDASGIYLGHNASTKDVWVLTALHITTGASAGSTVVIDGLTYNRQAAGIDGYGVKVGGDLRLVRYKRLDLAVPSLQAVAISTTVPVAGTGLMMVGYGQNRTEAATVEASTSDATSTTVGTGYHWSGTKIKRWGVNAIEADFLDILEVAPAVTGTTGTFSLGPYNTIGYMTDFDQPGSGQWLDSNEAQGSLGDSGGSAFHYSGGQWYLSGIFSSVAGFVGQAGSTSAFGNLSLLTDVASYSSSIDTALSGVTLVPEPSTVLLMAVGALAMLRRQRCA
jgi:hypothetical protein